MQAEVERKLERYGLTSSGRDWVLKALNPASERTCSGIPDQSTTRVLRPEFRAEQIVSPNVAATSTWDLYIFSTPGDVNAVYWASAPSPADFTAVTIPYGAEFGRIQLQDCVPTDNIVTVNLALTPPVLSDVISTTPVSRPLSFRHMYKSLTAHLLAPAVANQGAVYCAQFPPRFSTTSTAITTEEYTTGPVAWVVPRPVRLPLSEGELMLMSPDAYTGPAKDGFYVPLHCAGPSQPYPDPVIPTAWSLGPATAYGMFPYAVTSSAPSLGSFSHAPQLVRDGVESWPSIAARPKIVSGVGVVPHFTGWDSQYDNTNIGVAIFRGLAASSATVPGASVQLKALVGLEIVPRPLAPDRVFAKPAAVYDPRAMEVYYTILHELHQAYPASYNALGALLPVISTLLARLAPHLLPAALGAGAQLAGYLRDKYLPATKPPPPRLTPPPAKAQRAKPATPGRRRAVSVRSSKRR